MLNAHEQCFHYHVTWEVSFLCISSTPQFQICVKPNARLRPSMPLLFFLASKTKAVRVYLVLFISVTLQCIKFSLASFLKECSVCLAEHSVANKAFTYMRNVEGKRGAVLDVVQSCDQKHSLPGAGFVCAVCTNLRRFLSCLQSNVWQQKMLFCSCSVVLPPTAPFLSPPFFSAFLGVEIVERAFSKAPFCQPALIIQKKRISLWAVVCLETCCHVFTI